MNGCPPLVRFKSRISSKEPVNFAFMDVSKVKNRSHDLNISEGEIYSSPVGNIIMHSVSQVFLKHELNILTKQFLNGFILLYSALHS